MLVAVRLVLLWVVCWLVLVLESREMLPLRLLININSQNLNILSSQDTNNTKSSTQHKNLNVSYTLYGLSQQWWWFCWC
jgi:hypothetical protein